MAAKTHAAKLPHFSTYLKANVEHSFSFTQISNTDILNILKNFKRKCTEHDQLSMTLFKGASVSLSKSLSLIINQSLSTGIFPDRLKIAKVIPIFYSMFFIYCIETNNYFLAAFHTKKRLKMTTHFPVLEFSVLEITEPLTYVDWKHGWRFEYANNFHYLPGLIH